MSVTEMKELHWHYDLLNSIEVGIVVLNADFTVQVWNQFMQNHSNKLPSQVVGKPLFECFDEIDEAWLRAKAQPVLTLNTPVFMIWHQRPYLFRFTSNRPITSEAEYMYQNVTLFPLMSINGQPEQICMLVYDVTEQALNKARAERFNHQLTEISRTDGLTGIYNRRYWQERFEHAHKLALRGAHPCTVMMMDIDHFKKVNDTYGHPAGDKVIQDLAAVIKQAIRETDVAGRYGGEEFAIFLTDAQIEAGIAVGERIREMVLSRKVVHDDLTITYTVSVGVCEFTPAHKTALGWLELADQALYQAKQQGRNRVVAHASDH